jgi:ATP-dependent protease ClpP protease subunit
MNYDMTTTQTDTNNNFFEPSTAIVEIQDGNLYFTGDIDDKSAYRFMYLLHEIEKSKRDYVDKTCKLYLTSNGGHCTSGLLMYDVLRNSSLDITVIASGVISSTAIIPLLGTDKRKCTSNTNFMIQSASTWVSSTFSEMLFQQFVDIYSKHTKITKDMMQEEIFFGAKQALDLQLVNEVL